MKCNCGFTGSKDDFFKLAVVLGELIAREPKNKGGFNVGSVDAYACPKCGAIYCDARGKIENTKPL